MAEFSPFEISTPHITYACLGGFIVVFGMFSLFLREKLYIGEACWAFAFGIIIGPYGANIFNPRGWGGGDEAMSNTITLEITRVVLAIGVFAIGVELPKAYMLRHWKSLFFLLGPVMTWGWFVSAGFIFALVPGLNFLSSLAVAACLTPTDPILAQAVVGGKYASKHVPAHIRNLLAAESGCNDGAAFPFLYVALYLILDRNTGSAVRDWLLILWLYQVIMGVAIGATIGFTSRCLMKYCQRRELIDRQSYVAQYISMALFTIGVCTLLGTDDLLAAFSCGAAFAWDGFFNRQTEEAVFSSVIDLLFNIAAFVFVGAWMPFSSFQDAELTLTVWRLILIAMLVLLFRRLPVMLALYKWIPDVKTFREALFSGHFGPMGIGAVFISTLAADTLRHEAETASSQSSQAQLDFLQRSIQPITAFMVLCSILIHGLSIPSFSLSRRIHTVTRTWSRHTTLGANQLPDWTNHATLIKHPEEVIINRDPDLRRVRSRDLESGMEGIDQRYTLLEKTDSRNSKGSESMRETSDGDRDLLRITDPEEGREENPSITEWLEGPHKVIERRAGPGKEVEVEVIRNYGSPHAETCHFRWPHAHAREHLHAYLSKLKHLVEAVGEEGHGVNRKDETGTSFGTQPDVSGSSTPLISEEDPSNVPPPKPTTTEPLNLDRGSAAVTATATANTAPTVHHPTVASRKDRYEDDEEDGWASDRSGGVTDQDLGLSAYSLSSAQTQIADDLDRRSRVGVGGRSSLTPSSSIKGRRARRLPRRRHTTDASTSYTQSLSEAQAQALDEDDHHDTRDRSYRPTNVRHEPVPSPNLPRNQHHHHLDGIHALYAQHYARPHHPHRELSPSRSVRFREDAITANGRGSGTSTPRYSSVFHFGSPGVNGDSSVPGTPPPERAD
ncbi:hypothetical protein E1B28_010697 [Marasmius oreades]|uniref:Cation/H+ exchanger transmembrane domain-containing protein n=1 Tax=Marasmius oreades TaxID=181124 RepID=A0A9P7RXU3_9AGAR|nr:uncharacterized protein E1B28_010697 [Marasmius oreades]KAG7091677.1 hypothetical protein E1B28_010697 [Marasmius oreades]